MTRVLLVDDERDTREMYSEWLRFDGFDLRAATNAKDALRIARAFLPSVMVTDLRLRGGPDGIELTQRLRADTRTAGIRIIMLTGATFGGERERAAKSGVDCFVVKPCLPDQLAVEIRRVSQESGGVMNPSPNVTVLSRIRSEYLEMPGLTLNSAQVQRLCGIDDAACRMVLEALVEAGFLTLREDGSYSRSRDGETTRLHPAKASLSSDAIARLARPRRRAS
jgi:CheY-like chemotaxis protein